MHIRNAILKAADSIERHPGLFKWSSTRVANPDCGTPGCALGWIAHYVGCAVWRQKGGWNYNALANAMGTDGDGEFYSRMSETFRSHSWRLDATDCASALRAYADKYHPATKHAGLPDSVRQIFQTEAA